MAVSLTPKPKNTVTGTWPHGESQSVRKAADAKGAKK